MDKKKYRSMKEIENIIDCMINKISPIMKGGERKGQDYDVGNEESVSNERLVRKIKKKNSRAIEKYYMDVDDVSPILDAVRVVLVNVLSEDCE